MTAVAAELGPEHLLDPRQIFPVTQLYLTMTVIDLQMNANFS